MIYYEPNTQSIDIEKLLSDNGPLADGFTNYESRPQQIEMAVAVDAALQSGYHLAVEAGTGVGKSFAYLIPAIKQIVAEKKKILISTHTINLQEQLINKDLPFLAEHLEFDFVASLAKGRSNYICHRRLEYAIAKQTGLFNDTTDTLSELKTWASKTKNGSLSDLGYVPPMQIWDMVQSEHGNCKHRKCPHYGRCFYWKARRQLDKSDIIVANHSLLFSDLVLKEKSPIGVLPEYDSIILDEAHNIESVAEDHFGINISSYTLDYNLNRLYNTKTKRGLISPDQKEIVKLVRTCQTDSKLFFRQVNAWLDNIDKTGSCHKCPENFIDDNITPTIKELRNKLNDHIKQIENEDEMAELQRLSDRLRELIADINAFLNQSNDQHVYWVEVSGAKRNFVRLKSAPVKAAENIKAVLFDAFNSVILTSATLSCGEQDKNRGFEFFASRIGLGEHNALLLGSPYDYEKQVKLYIEQNMPDPNSPDFIRSTVEKLKHYLAITQGKAFVLFTSYSMLRKTADMLESWLDQNNITLLQQGKDLDRTTLLNVFKADTNSVLFGTSSFWQGVDVPGDSLSSVIITKLPFAVPNHPLIEGKIEQIRKEGGNPFYQYQLPQAIIKFKQGFGRLIRSHNDTGIIAVLDSRIHAKSYGKFFLQAIPKCKVIFSDR